MEAKSNQIDPSKLEGVGLVFVRKEDPVNLFVLSVTKQLYSLIGFYYTTKVSGKKQVHVILSDVCGIVSSSWMDPFTIKNLIYDELVTQLSVRELLPVLDKKGCVDKAATDKRNGDFKAVIAKITNYSMNTSVSEREWIKQLFGYEIPQPTSGYSSVEFVNSVIMETGNWDKITQNGKLSVEGLSKNVTPKFIPKNSEGKNHIFTKLGNDFKQIIVNKPNAANKLIQSYLVENGVFGPLRNICLPERDELKLSLRREQSISQHKSFLAKAVSSFVKMLLEDKKFFNTVVDGINHNTILGNKIDEKLKASVFDTLQCGNNIVSAIIGMLETGRVKYEDLETLINNYKHKVKHTLKVTELEITHSPSLESCKEKIVVFVTDECHGSKFDFNLKQLHTQLTGVKESIRKGKTPTLNINSLIDNLNCLIEGSGSGLSTVSHVDKQKSYGCVLTSGESKKIPVLFKSGKMTTIPTVGYDISKYNCAELRELLQAIDVLADEKCDYSNIRSGIAEKYSGCEQKSCTYH